MLECHLDKPFEIKLEIYHTGYRWEASYDKDFLRLDSVRPYYEWEPPYGESLLLRLGSEGDQRPPPEGRLVGREIFVFVPIQEGRTILNFSLKKPLEKPAVGDASYVVIIRP